MEGGFRFFPAPLAQRRKELRPRTSLRLRAWASELSLPSKEERQEQHICVLGFGAPHTFPLVRRVIVPSTGPFD